MLTAFRLFCRKKPLSLLNTNFKSNQYNLYIFIHNKILCTIFLNNNVTTYSFVPYYATHFAQNQCFIHLIFTSKTIIIISSFEKFGRHSIVLMNHFAKNIRTYFYAVMTLNIVLLCTLKILIDLFLNKFIIFVYDYLRLLFQLSIYQSLII